MVRKNNFGARRPYTSRIPQADRFLMETLGRALHTQQLEERQNYRRWVAEQLRIIRGYLPIGAKIMLRRPVGRELYERYALEPLIIDNIEFEPNWGLSVFVTVHPAYQTRTRFSFEIPYGSWSSPQAQCISFL
jgi:hypothetical protein